MSDVNRGPMPDLHAVTLLGFTVKELIPLRRACDSLGMGVSDLLRMYIETELRRVDQRKRMLEAELSTLCKERLR